MIAGPCRLCSRSIDKNQARIYTEVWALLSMHERTERIFQAAWRHAGFLLLRLLTEVQHIA